MNTEEFLRDHMGLKGEYYTEELKKIRAIPYGKEHDDAFDAILDAETDDYQREFTREAWELWGKALRLLEALQKEGYIGDGPKGDFYAFFWDNAYDF